MGVIVAPNLAHVGILFHCGCSFSSLEPTEHWGCILSCAHVVPGCAFCWDARARVVGLRGCSLAEGGLIAVCSWQCGFCANVFLCQVVSILNAFLETHAVRFLLDFKLIVCLCCGFYSFQSVVGAC